MSWKDYFYFSKSQRIGIFVLIALIIACSLANILLDEIYPTEKTTVSKEFKNEVAQFKAGLKDNRPHFKAYEHRAFNNWETYSQKSKTQIVVLFPFNPNSLDSVGFIKLGLKPFMAKNILKFRQKGGKFRKAEDFAKVYGLSSSQFEQLKSFIQIPAETKTTAEVSNIIIDINTADSCQLCQIKGVYPSLAKRIIAYGKKLGGYANCKQLNEVWGMSNDLSEKISPHIKIDPSKIQTISINKAGIDKLRSHPYINFYQAKAIYEYRRNKGLIKSFSDLKSIDADYFSEEFWLKIEPYLEFKSHF